jgi:hypothetical protein
VAVGVASGVTAQATGPLGLGALLMLGGVLATLRMLMLAIPPAPGVELAEAAQPVSAMVTTNPTPMAIGRWPMDEALLRREPTLQTRRPLYAPMLAAVALTIATLTAGGEI